MDVDIKTGRTKSPLDALLVSLSLTSEGGEPVCLLMQIHGKSKDAKIFEKESTSIVAHALLEMEGDLNMRFDGTLKELNGLIKGMFHTHSIEDIHMLVAALGSDGTLLVSHAGRAEAYVVRGGGASQITEYAKGRAMPVFVHIASGCTESQDVFIFSTQRVLRALTPAQLSQLVQRKESRIDAIIRALESEDECAAIAILSVPRLEGGLSGGGTTSRGSDNAKAALARGRHIRRQFSRSQYKIPLSFAWKATEFIFDRLSKVGSLLFSYVRIPERVQGRMAVFLADIAHPKKKKRTHFLLLAGVIAVLIVVWTAVQLTTSSQRGRSRVELKELVQEIDGQIRAAENRQIAGDTDAAGAILRRAGEQAKQVMDNKSGLFRVEALDLLDRIRSKQEEINNIVRLSPRIVINLGTKAPSVIAQGIIGVNDGEFFIYDRQNLYHVLLNSLDDPEKFSETALIHHGTYFSRYQTSAFLTTDNSVIERISGEPVLMKTEDPSGWVNAADMEAYLRYLYLLSPENNQIYKYERLSNRYSAPVEYNVNGNLADALDMTIDGNVYILKKGGGIIKLLRGEVQPFVVRRLPEGVLVSATKIFKSFNGNFYILDPKQKRVVVTTEGGPTGESTYLKQYVLEGDQVTELKGLYVDPDDTHLYILDEKRLYVIDL